MQSLISNVFLDAKNMARHTSRELKILLKMVTIIQSQEIMHSNIL